MNECTRQNITSSAKQISRQQTTLTWREHGQPNSHGEQRGRDGVVPIDDVVDLFLGLAPTDRIPEGAADGHHLGLGEGGARADIGGSDGILGAAHQWRLRLRLEGADGAGEGEGE